MPFPPVPGSPRIPPRAAKRGFSWRPGGSKSEDLLGSRLQCSLLRPWSSNLTSVPAPPLITQGCKGPTGRLSVRFKWVRQRAPLQQGLLLSGVTSPNVSYGALLYCRVTGDLSFLLCATQQQRSWDLAPPSGWNLHPLHQKRRVSTTGTQRNPTMWFLTCAPPPDCKLFEGRNHISLVHSQPRNRAWHSNDGGITFRSLKGMGSGSSSPGRMVRAFRGMKKWAGDSPEMGS